jgi:hypothetical protein
MKPLKGPQEPGREPAAPPRSGVVRDAWTARPATVNVYFRALRAFTNFCLTEGILEETPLRNVPGATGAERPAPAPERGTGPSPGGCCPQKRLTPLERRRDPPRGGHGDARFRAPGPPGGMRDCGASPRSGLRQRRTVPSTSPKGKAIQDRSTPPRSIPSSTETCATSPARRRSSTSSADPCG